MFALYNWTDELGHLIDDGNLEAAELSLKYVKDMFSNAIEADEDIFTHIIERIGDCQKTLEISAL